MTSRRDIVLSLPALGLALESLTSVAQTAELAHSTVFPARNLAAKETTSGSFQHVATGKLGTGEQVEIHNTMLKPGQMPHPPHRHAHSEFMVIREGSLSWTLGEVSMPAGPGDILYARSNELHGLKNVGSTDAHYAVIAIGSDAG